MNHLRSDEPSRRYASASGAIETFTRDLLCLYSRAIELNQLDAAERLLQCIEALAKDDPALGGALDEAYMRIAPD